MDVLQILDKLESVELIRQNRKAGNYMSIYCPFHGDGQERRPSCGVLLEDEYRNGTRYKAGWFHCFACGYANTMENAVTDLLKNHNMTQSGIDWLSENIPGFTYELEYEPLIPKDIMETLTSKYAVKQIQELTEAPKTFVSEEELAKYRFTVPYMYERKLTDEIIAEYDVGVDMNWIPPGRKKPVPCITIPVRDIHGRTLFFCRRSIAGKLYNYPEKVTKPVFGIDRIPENCKSLIICESAINALTARVYGYNAVALLGTGNSYQMRQLRELGVHEFVLCMDGDEAGRRAANKLKANLCKVGLVWTVNMPDGKDLNDCTKEEFDELYSSRE